MKTGADKVAKYARVKQSLREKITRRDFTPGGLLPSDRQLMRQLGVCRQTVIRALHELRAEGIVRREHGKGTFVNQSKSQGEVGILTYLNRASTDHSVYPQNLLRSVVNRLCELGSEPRLYSTYGMEVIGNIHAHGQKVLEHCARGRLRCLIVSWDYNVNEVQAAVARWGVYVIGSYTEETRFSTYNVGDDNKAVTAEGIGGLLKRGLQKIALITGKQMYATVNNRVEAYLRVLEENRLSIRPGWIRADLEPSPKAGYEQFRRLWAMDDRPEAVLICDDFMALGATQAMVELGLQPPRDLTVMVLTNRGSGLVFPLPVIALELDSEPVGAAVADMALRLMRGETVKNPHWEVKPSTRIYEMTSLQTESGSPETSWQAGVLTAG